MLMEIMHAAVGRAVIAAQVFEATLAALFEFFRMQSEPEYLQESGGILTSGAFKVPVKNMVRTLAEKGSVAPDLEVRLSQYVEDRHTLVHRWMLQNGWPEENDPDGWKPFADLAVRVETEAKFLTRSLLGYVLKYAEPEWANSHATEYRERMRLLFHRAHLDVEETGK
jgi:hypothetical protein